MTMTTRAGKGSALTFAELDANWVHLLAADAAEASARAGADIALASSIASEAIARAAADSALSSAIAAKQNALGYTPLDAANFNGATFAAEAYASQLIINGNDAELSIPASIFNNVEFNNGYGTLNFFAYRGTIAALEAVQAGDDVFFSNHYARSDDGSWYPAGYYKQTVNGIVDDIVTSYWTWAYASDLTGKGQGFYLWGPRDEVGLWLFDGNDYSAISMPTRGDFALRFDENATDSAGTSFDAGAYKVGATPGIDFSGPVTSITVVKGIVTAAV